MCWLRFDCFVNGRPQPSYGHIIIGFDIFNRIIQFVFTFCGMAAVWLFLVSTILAAFFGGVFFFVGGPKSSPAKRHSGLTVFRLTVFTRSIHCVEIRLKIVDEDTPRKGSMMAIAKVCLSMAHRCFCRLIS